MVLLRGFASSCEALFSFSGDFFLQAGFWRGVRGVFVRARGHPKLSLEGRNEISRRFPFGLGGLVGRGRGLGFCSYSHEFFGCADNRAGISCGADGFFNYRKELSVVQVGAIPGQKEIYGVNGCDRQVRGIHFCVLGYFGF